MSTRTATILAIVMATFVIGGTALAIGNQFGADPVVSAAAGNPDAPPATTTSTFTFSGLVTLTEPEGDPLSPPESLTPATTSTSTFRPDPTSTTAPPDPTPTTTAMPATTTTRPAPAATTTTVTPTPTTTTTAAPAGGSFSSSKESQFLSLINSVRADVGVPALTVSSSLNSYARNWAFHMSDTNTFQHSDIGSLLGPWSTVGENIAYGWSVTSMHNALVNSSGHYANLTSANFTHVGIGVWVEDGGKIWATHVFGG